MDGPATSKRRTLLDCLRRLPFDEALAVADSALRHADSTSAELHRLAADARGPGAKQLRRVVAHASAKARNPFESVLRAIAIEAGLDVEPQVKIGGDRFLGTPDLVDVGRRLVLEADSFAWHGSRVALRNDARRYNDFVAAGWIVLRFSWEDVMGDPELVRGVLEDLMRRPDAKCAHCAA